jgi:FkbM family methyltransferase
VIFDSILTAFLKIPYFKGKSRLEAIVLRRYRHPLRTKVYGGLLMELDLGEWIQLQLRRGHWLEPLTLKRYTEILTPGDVFVDIGAHVGFHTLVARQKVGADGLVIAVEPQPYNASKILNNWRANGFSNLKLLVAASGDTDGMMELSDQEDNDRSQLSLVAGCGKNEAQKFIVPIVRMDSVMAEHKISKIKLLKMDVEGFELEVIKGFGSRLADVDHVLFEILDDGKSERSTQLLDLLRAANFEIKTVGGAAWKLGDSVPENNLWAELKK